MASHSPDVRVDGPAPLQLVQIRPDLHARPAVPPGRVPRSELEPASARPAPPAPLDDVPPTSSDLLQFVQVDLTRGVEARGPSSLYIASHTRRVPHPSRAEVLSPVSGDPQRGAVTGGPAVHVSQDDSSAGSPSSRAPASSWTESADPAPPPAEPPTDSRPEARAARPTVREARVPPEETPARTLHAELRTLSSESVERDGLDEGRYEGDVRSEERGSETARETTSRTSSDGGGRPEPSTEPRRDVAAPPSDMVADLRRAMGWGDIDRAELATRAAHVERSESASPMARSAQAVLQGVPLRRVSQVTTERTALGEYTQRIYDVISERWRAVDLDDHQKAVGIQGHVTVVFRVHRGGRVSDLGVLKSSGQSTLDGLALSAIPKRLPSFSSAVSEASVVQQITFHYRNPLVEPERAR